MSNGFKNADLATKRMYGYLKYIQTIEYYRSGLVVSNQCIENWLKKIVLQLKVWNMSRR